MPTNKEIASELWLHVNSPETLDKEVGDQIAKLRREARFDELTDFQNERKEIDDAVEEYLNSPSFEKYRDAFSAATSKYSSELSDAVAKMGRELKRGSATSEISTDEREAYMDEMKSDLAELDQAPEQEPNRDEPQHEH